MSNLLWSNDFLKQESRRGFVISELMKRSWAADIKILDELLDICQKHDIKMFACYGTLLGAVREHGFIPWDDDIDMGMLGEDYVRFLDILSNEYSDRFNILNPYTRTWYNMNFTHITNAKEPSFNKEHLNEWHGCPFMTGPDVYPYYYLPRNSDEEQFILNVLEKIDAVISMNKMSLTQSANDGSFDSASTLNETIATALVELQHITGYEFSDERPLDNQLEILYDQVCRITEESDADYVARYDEYSKDRTKKFPKEYFMNIVPIPFENIDMPAPIGYDAILRARFGGSYIIPKREMAAHDYPYYLKQLDEDEYRQACIVQKELPMNDSIGIPIDALSVATDKKRILYHTGFKSMLTNCDAVSNKIKMVLEYAEDAKDTVELWWMPDELLQTDVWALDLAVPSLIKEYEELISDYKICYGHLCSMRMDTNGSVDLFDEYYGDKGELAESFRNAGKLVTIQDYNSPLVEIATEYKKNKESEFTARLYEKNIVILDDWKSKLYSQAGRRKKAVLYVNSISVMYQNQNSYLNRIKVVLEVFKEHTDDMILIWRPCRINDTLCDAFDERFIQEYEAIIDEHRDCQWILFEETGESYSAVSIADAYYGDPSEELLMCRDRGKPVMVQNVMIESVAPPSEKGEQAKRGDV